MDKRAFKSALYQQFARVGKALSSPKRLELLELLCQGEKAVEVLFNPDGHIAKTVDQFGVGQLKTGAN